MINKNYNQFILLLIIFAAVLIADKYIYAWTEPAGSPPDANVAAPLNVSANSQIKSGAVQVNGFRNIGTTILDGNVGIGTASPDANYRLTISGGGIKAENASAQPAGYFNSTGGGRAIQTGNGSILFANLAGTGSRMVVVDASGVLSTQAIPGGGPGTNYWTLSGSNLYPNDTSYNVGIGTNDPLDKLHVAGGNIRLDDHQSIIWGGGSAMITGENPNNKLHFITSDIERMVIDYDGNVGIGTEDPTQKLEVNGGVRFNTSTSRPTCSATTRGTFWFVKGGTGVADSAAVCAKNASNTYAWTPLY
jgi:hypothetical protein